ncbi:MAG: hypothetical protein E7168_02440 [Firmicutes bacterium]|nr:hypothetical protein [Bacillota bacterium]
MLSFDLLILIVLIVAGICFFRKFSSSVYFIAALDIFFRILTFIKNNLGVAEVRSFIGEYFPESIPGVIYKYTDGILTNVLMWVYVFLFVVFLFYTVRILWNKR